MSIKKGDVVGAAALSRFALCKTPGAAVVTAAATDEPFGIVQDGAAIGESALFCFSGHTKAIASAAISKGDVLMPAASGRVATHDDGATSVKVAVALTAATAAGDEIWVDLFANKTIADA